MQMKLLPAKMLLLLVFGVSLIMSGDVKGAYITPCDWRVYSTQYCPSSCDRWESDGRTTLWNGGGHYWGRYNGYSGYFVGTWCSDCDIHRSGGSFERSGIDPLGSRYIHQAYNFLVDAPCSAPEFCSNQGNPTTPQKCVYTTYSGTCSNHALPTPTTNVIAYGGWCADGSNWCNRAPVAYIDSPANGASFNQGTAITFTGHGTDADGVGDIRAYAWAIDGNTSNYGQPQVSNQTSFTKSDLAPGTHTVQFWLADTWAASAIVQRTFTVNPGFSCTDAVPANATLCPGDDTGLTANTARTLVSVCGVPKCEYTCSVGYTYDPVAKICKPGIPTSGFTVNGSASAISILPNGNVTLAWSVASPAAGTAVACWGWGRYDDGSKTPNWGAVNTWGVDASWPDSYVAQGTTSYANSKSFNLDRSATFYLNCWDQYLQVPSPDPKSIRVNVGGVCTGTPSPNPSGSQKCIDLGDTQDETGLMVSQNYAFAGSYCTGNKCEYACPSGMEYFSNLNGTGPGCAPRQNCPCTDPYGACNKACGGGKKSRTCPLLNTSTNRCTDSYPDERDCNTQRCDDSYREVNP